MARLTSLCTALALVVALLAVIASTRRHLLLKVPKVGFVLYAMAGGNVPPYMDASIFKHHKEWLRPNDVIISVPGKSGTTWMMYTVNMLRARGKLPPGFRDIYEEVPWAEFQYYPGQTIQDRIDYIHNISRKYPFNALKTHDSPPNVPVRDDVKYIVAFRNPYDAVASARPFFQSHGKKFAQMWGGFPPEAGDKHLGPDADWERFMLVDAGDGKPFAGAIFIDVLKNWWPYRFRPNVLFVHYSDRIKDDATQLKRISKFLDIGLSEAELQNIAKQLTFSEMKKTSDEMELTHVFDAFKARGLVPDDVFLLQAMHEGEDAMMNKGPARAGDKELTKTLSDGLTELMKKHLTPEMIEWFINGGPVPGAA